MARGATDVCGADCARVGVETQVTESCSPVALLGATAHRVSRVTTPGRTIRSNGAGVARGCTADNPPTVRMTAANARTCRGAFRDPIQ